VTTVALLRIGATVTRVSVRIAFALIRRGGPWRALWTTVRISALIAALVQIAWLLERLPGQ
jgi:hypothetical protein